MIVKLSEEVDVKASISKAWEVYGSHDKIGMIVQAELGDLSSVTILEEGDCGVGKVIEVTPRPGVTTFTRYKERFTKIDHEKKVREFEIIDGWYLDLGFTAFRMKLELIDKNQHEDACTARLTIEYEGSEEIINAHGSTVTTGPFMSIMEIVNRYIENNKT